jgi:hypothetical protein
MVMESPWKTDSAVKADKQENTPQAAPTSQKKITTTREIGITTRQRIPWASESKPEVTGAAQAFHPSVQTSEMAVRAKPVARAPWCDAFEISPWACEKSR